LAANGVKTVKRSAAPVAAILTFRPMLLAGVIPQQERVLLRTDGRTEGQGLIARSRQVSLERRVADLLRGG
jgi:hypothetical protein